MKKLKKILAAVLSMAMVLGMSMTSFAADSGADGKYGTADDKGSITVQNVDPSVTGIAVYPILVPVYDAAKGNFLRYEPADAEYGKILASLNDDYQQISADEINALGAAKVDGTQITGTIVDEFPATPEAGKTYFKKVNTGTTEDPSCNLVSGDDFQVGMYLIVLSGAESTIYNYAIASINYTNTDGNGNLMVDGTLNLEDSTVLAKSNSHPDVEKTVDKSSANINDTVKYDVVINPVPYYGGEHPVMNIEDTLSTGLTLNKDGITVELYKKGADAPTATVTYVKGVEATGETPAVPASYTVKFADGVDDEKKEAINEALEDGFAFTEVVNQSLKIDFAKNENYVLNMFEGGKVVVTYFATLNDQAAINEIGNNNDVKLNYTRDSKVDSDDVKDEEESKTFTYTFDIDGAAGGEQTDTKDIVTKMGQTSITSTDSTPLDGAEFTLSVINEAGAKVLYDRVIDNTTVDIDNPEGRKGVVISKNGGQLPIKGLAAGTYYLQETKAPTGYSLNTHEYVIKIEAWCYGDKNSETPEEFLDEKFNGWEKGQLKGWKISIDGQAGNIFTVKHEGTTSDAELTQGKPGENGTVAGVAGTEIPNTKISELPSTGGIGTTIFTIGGCAIMIVAAGLFFISRRKSAKQS